MASSSSSSRCKIQIIGDVFVTLHVDVEQYTLSLLRKSVKEVLLQKSSTSRVPRSVRFVFMGRILYEDEHPLSMLGIKDDSKILSRAIHAADDAEVVKLEFLARMRAAAWQLAERHSAVKFDMELGNWDGKTRPVPETDRKGAMIALLFHGNARRFIDREEYKLALDLLIMAEKHFSLCVPKLLKINGNFSMLQLDIVWCYFMVRDNSSLLAAKRHLVKARKGFQEVYQQDAPIYVRLELLEGVVAYHRGVAYHREMASDRGMFDECRDALNSAKARFDQHEIKEPKLKRAYRRGEEQEGESSAATAATTKADEGKFGMREVKMEKLIKGLGDVEMEEELMKGFTQDAVVDFDMDLTEEGKAITEYLSLLDAVSV